MKRLAVLFALIGAPAFAASGPFFSLFNTDFVVLIAFLVFIGVLVYFKVPGILIGMLDKRAQQIRSELDEARALREEAQTLLASYERKQREVADQADRIVAHAARRPSLRRSRPRPICKPRSSGAFRRQRNRSPRPRPAPCARCATVPSAIAISAAAQVIAAKTSAADQNKLIDSAIDEVSARLH